MFQARVTVFPEIAPRPDGMGGFTPASFTDLLHRHIELPGLDRAWTHTLIAVTVADDRASAELTVHSEPVAALSLDANVRIVQGVPPAHIRVLDTSGAVLAEATHPAPLHAGQEVEIGGDHYHVTVVDWPGRHPETGVCEGDLDWQHAVVTPQPRPPVVPTSAQ